MWMYKLLFKLRSNRGQAMSEYGLILALVAVAVIGALITFRTQLVTLFNNLATTLDGAL